MVFIEIYLLSVGASVATLLLFAKALKKRLIREGYVFTKNERSTEETILAIFNSLKYALIPGFNIIISGVSVFQNFDKTYELAIEEMLNKGLIRYDDKMEHIKKDKDEEDNILQSNLEPERQINSNPEIDSITEIKKINSEIERLTILKAKLVEMYKPDKEIDSTKKGRSL